MTREFDLNIERVLENWTVAHALREVIANALDEQALTGTAEPQIFADAEARWHIRVVGKFGVGLKDALAGSLAPPGTPFLRCHARQGSDSRKCPEAVPGISWHRRYRRNA